MVLDFILSNHTDVVVSFNLGISNFFVEVVTTFVNANCVSLEEKGIVDLLCELIAARVHWDQLKLSWREPEIPFSTCVLAQNSDEALERSEDSSVNHNWSGKSIFQRFCY